MFGVSRYRNEQRSGIAREGNFAMIDDDLRPGDRGRLGKEEEEEMRLHQQKAPRYACIGMLLHVVCYYMEFLYSTGYSTGYSTNAAPSCLPSLPPL
jgi:hypothetical protein